MSQCVWQSKSRVCQDSTAKWCDMHSPLQSQEAINVIVCPKCTRSPLTSGLNPYSLETTTAVHRSSWLRAEMVTARGNVMDRGEGGRRRRGEEMQSWNSRLRPCKKTLHLFYFFALTRISRGDNVRTKCLAKEYRKVTTGDVSWFIQFNLCRGWI